MIVKFIQTVLLLICFVFMTGCASGKNGASGGECYEPKAERAPAQIVELNG